MITSRAEEAPVDLEARAVMGDSTTKPLDVTGPDVAALDEAHDGVWGGCWCMGVR